MNRRHKYAPSVVAVVLSASRMIAMVQDVYDREPHLTARILSYWSNAFSAAVSFVHATLRRGWGGVCEFFLYTYFIFYFAADSVWDSDLGGSMSISIPRTGHVYDTCGASGA